MLLNNQFTPASAETVSHRLCMSPPFPGEIRQRGHQLYWEQLVLLFPPFCDVQVLLQDTFRVAEEWKEQHIDTGCSHTCELAREYLLSAGH